MDLPPFPPALDTEDALKRVLADVHTLTQEGEGADRETYLAALRTQLATVQLDSRQSPLASAYEDVITYLEFSLLPLLDPKDQARLFRSHLLPGLAIDVDLKSQIELLFILYGFPAALAVRQRLLHALLDNEEVVGDAPLTVASSATPLPPTIKNWLVDFLSFGSVRGLPGALEVANYLQQSANVRLLRPEQREQLRQVLNLYAFLLHPPIVERLQKPSSGVAPHRATPIVPASQPEDFRSALLRSLFEEAQLEETIYIEEERLLAGQPYRFSNIARTLQAAREQQRPERVQATLFLLARSGDLRTLLSRDSVSAAFLEREILPRVLPALKRQRTGLDLASLQADFRAQPNRPAYRLLFLQAILTETYRGDQAAAARVGARLCGLLVQQGDRDAAHFAYYDAASEHYHWGDLTVDSQGVPTPV